MLTELAFENFGCSSGGQVISFCNLKQIKEKISDCKTKALPHTHATNFVTGWTNQIAKVNAQTFSRLILNLKLDHLILIRTSY